MNFFWGGGKPPPQTLPSFMLEHRCILKLNKKTNKAYSIWPKICNQLDGRHRPLFMYIDVIAVNDVITQFRLAADDLHTADDFLYYHEHIKFCLYSYQRLLSSNATPFKLTNNMAPHVKFIRYVKYQLATQVLRTLLLSKYCSSFYTNPLFIKFHSKIQQNKKTNTTSWTQQIRIKFMIGWFFNLPFWQ